MGDTLALQLLQESAVGELGVFTFHLVRGGREAGGQYYQIYILSDSNVTT